MRQGPVSQPWVGQIVSRIEWRGCVCECVCGRSGVVR